MPAVANKTTGYAKGCYMNGSQTKRQPSEGQPSGGQPNGGAANEMQRSCPCYLEPATESCHRYGNAFFKDHLQHLPPSPQSCRARHCHLCSWSQSWSSLWLAIRPLRHQPRTCASWCLWTGSLRSSLLLLREALLLISATETLQKRRFRSLPECLVSVDMLNTGGYWRCKPCPR